MENIDVDSVRRSVEEDKQQLVVLETLIESKISESALASIDALEQAVTQLKVLVAEMKGDYDARSHDAEAEQKIMQTLMEDYRKYGEKVKESVDAVNWLISETNKFEADRVGRWHEHGPQMLAELERQRVQLPAELAQKQSLISETYAQLESQSRMVVELRERIHEREEANSIRGPYSIFTLGLSNDAAGMFPPDTGDLHRELQDRERDLEQARPRLQQMQQELLEVTTKAYENQANYVNLLAVKGMMDELINKTTEVKTNAQLSLVKYSVLQRVSSSFEERLSAITGELNKEDSVLLALGLTQDALVDSKLIDEVELVTTETAKVYEGDSIPTAVQKALDGIHESITVLKQVPSLSSRIPPPDPEALRFWKNGFGMGMMG